MEIKGYRKLVVWQEAKKLVTAVYRLTENFPRAEDYALKGQMRRAAVSVLANLSEGWLRRSVKDKLHFLEMSEGSLLELEAEAEIAHEVGYWKMTEYEEFDKQRSKVAYLLFRYKQKISGDL